MGARLLLFTNLQCFFGPSNLVVTVRFGEEDEFESCWGGLDPYM